MKRCRGSYKNPFGVKSLAFILNCGSSSVKFRAIDLNREETRLKGLVQRDSDLFSNIIGVGHRVVHRGEAFQSAVFINEDALKKSKSASL